MKKLLAITLMVVAAATAFAQYFEGKVTYQNTYKSKTPNLKDEQLISMLGSKEEYYIKGGNYKSVTNGSYLRWQIYVNKDNKLYNRMSITKTLYWNDASYSDDSILKVELNKGVTEILGYKCDELVLTCKSGVQKYYFNSALSVDINYYTNHKYCNWYDYLKQANAVPLKMVIDNDQFLVENTAVAVKPMKLNDKDFQLPANAKTKKSPN